MTAKISAESGLSDQEKIVLSLVWERLKDEPSHGENIIDRVADFQRIGKTNLVRSEI